MAAKTIKGIIVEIGGNTTGLGKALKDVESTSRDLESSLKKVNKALEFDPSSADLAAEKQKVLASYVDETRQKLETLESVQDQIRQQYASGEIGQTAYLDFQKELAYTKKKLEDLEHQQKEFGDTVDAVANGELENFNATLRETDDAAEEAGDGFTVAKGAVSDFISDAVQEGISQIKELIGQLFELSEATEEYRIMQAKLAGSTDTFGYSMDFAGNAYQNFYRYLGDDQAATNAITNLMGLRTSTDSLSRLAEGAIAVWTAYGDSIPIESLTESINESAQVAKVTGVLADALNWAGISEDYFNAQLEKCLNTQERANYIAAVLNDTYGESKARFDASTSSILDHNAAEQQLMHTQAMLGETMQPVNTALMELKNEILIALYPLIVMLAEGFLGLLNWFKEHPAAINILIGAVIALAAAFGVLAAAMAIQGLISMVSGGFVGLSGVMSALPVIAFVAAIAAIVGSLVWLMDHIDQVKIICKESWDSMVSDYKAGNEAIVTETHAAHVAQVSQWQETQAAAKAVQETMVLDAHAAHVAQVTAWQEMCVNVSAMWSSFWNSVVSWGSSQMASLRSAISSGLNTISSNTASFCQSVLSRFTSWGSGILNAGRNAISNLHNTISSGLAQIKNLFNFSWNLPHIPLPHFHVSGSFSLNPPSVPSFGVQWYAKGAILNGAQLFGMMGNNFLGGGEAGPEAVLPLSSFYDNLSGILTGFLRMHVPHGDDTRAILDRLDGIYSKLSRLQVVMDSGALVGELLDPIDAALSDNLQLAERGV